MNVQDCFVLGHQFKIVGSLDDWTMRCDRCGLHTSLNGGSFVESSANSSTTEEE